MVSLVKKVLAVASGGGHWIQLLRLKSAFEGCDTRFVSTFGDYQKDIDNARLYVVTDANIKGKLKVIKMFLQVFYIVLRFRPDIVVTTGAAPGFAAIMFGKLFGAKTIWLDSIANAETLSCSGKQAKRFSDIWLTQWEELEAKNGPIFKGRIL